MRLTELHVPAAPKLGLFLGRRGPAIGQQREAHSEASADRRGPKREIDETVGENRG
jgi:hypothetical protein